VLISIAIQPAVALTLLNVSYSGTEELFIAYNKLFTQYYNNKTKQDVITQLSNGASGEQARAVINGLDADVVTLALAYDIDMIAKKSKLLPLNWQQKLPAHSCPYTSIIVFLVRKNNPKHINDWPDLIRKDVQVITPSPKTSGGARWNYLAAWGYALKNSGGDEKAAKEFVSKLYKNAPILDISARGATTTFIQRSIGDVLITWENEALLAIKEFGKDQFVVIRPSITILAEPPVAVVEHNTDKKGTTQIAKEYLTYLYSKNAQELIAKFGFRPADKDIAKKYIHQFPMIKIFTITDFGGWEVAQKKFFEDGALFDQIYVK
jgi:sulfate transport system substrate-binding protein